ncbi:TetR/AcrR family transcriptional regulator [Clostridium sp. AM58-1XD]|uniref:TetR/AcrR family transcriptional regulator n=1 Tax=Clostridium sp. AM58-1XD TaxID=2292307 RepID=UPI000E532E00|nr:TetR/AcrR family transcriptional regulator [Clostridium sp. AM58-1XD]RGZ01925.1 TetR/AcrR family transcriptional regulator [Clostridium sp. AM58-1XD]
MRTVKEAEERRNEILDAAERLFTQKGYQKSTVVDILNAVGIAKGTFYYYFKSKEEVMDAMIERIVLEDVRKAEQIVKDSTLTPVQKICGIIQVQQPVNGDRKDQMLEQFHCPCNAEIHQKSIVQSILCLSPILAEAVRQGIDEGIFHTDYPQEVMEILISSGQVLFDPAVVSWGPDVMAEKMEAFLSSMEILLGAERGSFECMRELLAARE